jgi:hypothetical protein
MRLAKNFSLYEFTRSQYASRKGIANNPSSDEVEALRNLAQNVLQPIRDHFGKAVNISSGFRCKKLNKAIGGSTTSQHTKGEAADIEIFGVDNLELARWISRNLPFDQLILEYYDVNDGPNSGWVHVSFKKSGNRNAVLTKNRGERGYQVGLPPSPQP